MSSRQAGRGLARRALSAELRAKGVDAEVAAEAVEQVDDEDERAAAQRLVARKVPGMRRLDRATATRRLMGMLARKGYNGGLAAAVVREALDNDGADDVGDRPTTDGVRRPRRGRPAALTSLRGSVSGRVGVPRALAGAGLAR